MCTVVDYSIKFENDVRCTHSKKYKFNSFILLLKSNSFKIQNKKKIKEKSSRNFVWRIYTKNWNDDRIFTWTWTWNKFESLIRQDMSLRVTGEETKQICLSILCNLFLFYSRELKCEVFNVVPLDHQ